MLDCSHPDAPEEAEQANERGMAAFKAKDWERALTEYTQAVNFLGDGKSSLGDAKSSLGDDKSSLGD
jgi:hypothetical protein